MGLIDWLFGRLPSDGLEAGVPHTIGPSWHPGPGWLPLFDPAGRFHPPLSAWHDLEVIREGWDAPVKYRDLSRYSNVYGLWWRPGSGMIDVTPRPAQNAALPMGEAEMLAAQHVQPVEKR